MLAVGPMLDNICKDVNLMLKRCLALFPVFTKQGKGMLQPHQLSAKCKDIIPKVDHVSHKNEIFEDVLNAVQKVIVLPPWVRLAFGPRPGVWKFVRVNVSELAPHKSIVFEYLKVKIQRRACRWKVRSYYY